MTDPIWVPLRAVVAIQRELITEHGGLSGPPRHGDLEAALGRPVNLHAYAQTPPTLSRLAAAYGFALARGHCFPDGNKRVALAIIDVFLRMNGLHLTADELDVVDTIQSLAAGDLTEDQLSDWLSPSLDPTPCPTNPRRPEATRAARPRAASTRIKPAPRHARTVLQRR